MNLLHTSWIKPTNKKQATWIANYLSKKDIIQCPNNPKSEANLAKDIMSGGVVNDALRQKMESAWGSSIKRAKDKKNQATITISNDSLKTAKANKRIDQSVSAYIEELINSIPKPSTTDLLEDFRNSSI
jgi:predicted CopG family antitoxin